MMKIRKPVFAFWIALCLIAVHVPLRADEDPHGLTPAENMVFMPKLAGLKNKQYRNQSGREEKDRDMCGILLAIAIMAFLTISQYLGWY